MPLAGSCEICHNISRVLMICVYCGKRACIGCLDPKTGKCKDCQEK